MDAGIHGKKGRSEVMGHGAQVAIVVADLTAWVLIMVVVGKWPEIRKWFRARVSRKASAKSDA